MPALSACEPRPTDVAARRHRPVPVAAPLVVTDWGPRETVAGQRIALGQFHALPANPPAEARP